MMIRLQLNIQGLVQGVGFRPQVYRIANELKLTGFIKNAVNGVTIEIQGEQASLFLGILQKNMPPLSHITQIVQNEIPIQKDPSAFIITQSDEGNSHNHLARDSAICDLCLHDLFDPQSRFYLYPFVTCMHCGPRYSLIRALPYDRKYTSQNNFPFCDDCQQEYHNSENRRFHAETIACQRCGPRLTHDITDIVATIQQGQIVAIKSLGGYQLICDARNESAIKQLRLRKKRTHKPFAVMMLNLKNVLNFADASAIELKTLASAMRPIVILKEKAKKLPTEVAPGLNRLGIMLPYTPLHYLIFHALLNYPTDADWLIQENDLALVVTSGNVSEASLIIDNTAADTHLKNIADLIVHCDRDIVSAIDDSVTHIVANSPALIRRARGYAPLVLELPYEIPSTLALGAYLKNTICVTRGREAFVSPHIGNLNHRDTIAMYHHTIQHLLKTLNVKPECIAHDKHPDFYSTQVASTFNVPSMAVQHHHAHLAAVAVEHGITTPAIGLALDGFGLGEENQSWGGELLYYHTENYRRLGSLTPLLQPGGEQAIKHPWRMAVSALLQLNQIDLARERFQKHPEFEAVLTLLNKSELVIPTSSCGRLFDAASSLLGLCDYSDYEGQAALLLEHSVTTSCVMDNSWILHNNQLNMLPLVQKLLSCDSVTGANLFHGTLATALVSWVEQQAKLLELKHVLLAGGCFLNKVLAELVIELLQQKGLLPLYPRQYPANDGGISLGQAWIAGNVFRN